MSKFIPIRLKIRYKVDAIWSKWSDASTTKLPKHVKDMEVAEQITLEELKQIPDLYKLYLDKYCTNTALTHA